MPDVAAPAQITFKTLLAPGVAAVRRYWKPFLLLQGSAFLLVVGYYTSAPIRSLCDHLSEFKQHGGLIFTAIAAAFAGGLMPEFAKALVLGDRAITRQRIRNVAFVLVTYALSGMMTDLFYRGMGWLFGTDTRFPTVLRKVLFDQLLYTPVYGTPYWVVVYLLRANRYNLITTAAQLSPGWYLERVVPLLIPSWVFWTPMVLLVYSLPGPLQFCMFCFASAAWSLVMVFVATQEAAAERSRMENRE
jgi:hypothetical protein